jgi:hypothetical protein
VLGAAASVAGPRRMLAALHEGPMAERILKALGLPTTAPPTAPARDPPQGTLFDAFAQASPPDDFDQTTHENP